MAKTMDVKCDSCPECGHKEYVNKNLVGDGFRQCRKCGQEWWIDIFYPSHINNVSIKERIDLSKKLEHLGVVNIDKRIYGKKKK